VVLLAQIYAYDGGPATDLDGTPTVRIVNIGTGTVALAATTVGVTHPGTGAYGYTWTTTAALPVGDYLVTWAGTASGGAVTATETVTVLAAVTGTVGRVAERICYCTREDVKRALDSAETARNNGQVDRAIGSATAAIHGLTHRVFYPWTGARTFDWPSFDYAWPWRLWLNQNELVSITALTSGGVAVPIADVLLRPDTGPPFTRVELDLGSNAAFGGGTTPQRDITITGVWGYTADEEPAGALAGAVSGSATTITVTDSSVVGVGQILRIDTERLIVTGKRMTTTGQTLQAPLTAQASATTVAVTDGTAYAEGEEILLDAERMLIVDIAGNNLIVKRAWDGSVLAVHTGSTVYAPRTLTVTRGALGTGAGSHADTAPVLKHTVPPLIRQAAIAEALNSLFQETSGYARQVGSGDNQREATARGLASLRDQVYTAHARKARMRAV
jgi:hypothetical protein